MGRSPVGSAAAAFLFFIESPSGISTLNTHLTFSPTLLASINFDSNHPDTVVRYSNGIKLSSLPMVQSSNG